MKLLPATWIDKEFELQILQRKGNVAIAAKWWREDIAETKYPKGEDGLGGKLCQYEVAIIQKTSATKVWLDDQEVSFEAKESWPTEHMWGYKGFTAKTMTHALLKMDELVKAETAREVKNAV